VNDLLPADRLARSVSRVTTTILGKTFRPIEPAGPIERWRTVVLPIPGARPVTVALSADRRSCAAMAAAMLGLDEEGLELGMIDDFMRELLNMTAGQIKRELALDQALGLPRVLDGDALFASRAPWAHHVLDADSINLVVSLLPAIV
jgi:hypothetical protein